MTLEELREEHEKLKEFPFRKDMENSSPLQRMEYYKAFKKHLFGLIDVFAKDNGELDISVYRKDFWWAHDCFYSEIIAARGEGDRIGKRALSFIDIYFEILLSAIHACIEAGEMVEVVAIDIQCRAPKGFKVYQKKNGNWLGIKYIKFGEERK